jgi:predicted NBD/HSP70 family sugar kinase
MSRDEPRTAGEPPTAAEPGEEPSADAGRLEPRGSSQGGLRQYNERVLLQAIRLHGPLASAELARLTRLTAQTVSTITKRLLDEGLLLKGEPVRGKVGQPSVPLALNPEGAYAVGIKVGRRSMDILLVDFTGRVRQRWDLDYEVADPGELLRVIGLRLKEIRRKLGPERHARVQGIGVAAPLSMGGWQQLLGLPPAVAERWQRLDLRAEVAALTELPVALLKDTAAACVAELVAGRGRTLKSFVYVFVDTFIGGGLVLDSHLRGGVSGNAGAIGSLPLAMARPGADTPPAQLLSVASLLTLERRYAAAGLDTAAVTGPQALEAPWRSHTAEWLKDAGTAVAHAVQNAACLLDIEGVILDGSFSRELLAALLAETTAALGRYDWEGVTRPALLAGTIGSDARALGGALLPLHANFAPDRDLFLKVTDDAA